MNKHKKRPRFEHIGRREFITQASIGALVLTTLSRPLGARMAELEAIGDGATRIWLGPQYWANRLQDWRWHEGRIECVSRDPNLRLMVATRTTEQIIHKAGGFVAEAQVGFTTGDAGDGFGGFLIGIGGGNLDWVAQGNVFGIGGKGGGIGCVLRPDGRVAMLDNRTENEREPKALPVEVLLEPQAGSVLPQTGARLRLEVSADKEGSYELLLSAYAQDDRLLSSVRLKRPLSSDGILGGFGLLADRGTAARQPTLPWFEDLQLSGKMVEVHPERLSGPVAGFQYTLGTHGLKLLAQMMPMGETAHDKPVDITTLRLDYRLKGVAGRWTSGPKAAIRVPSQTALFEIPAWDRFRAYELRLVPLQADQREVAARYFYQGSTLAEPRAATPLKMINFHCPRMVGAGVGALYEARPAERPFERFTSNNLILPARAAQERIEFEHKPHLLLFTGDQIYEHIPSQAEFKQGSPRSEDYLYKWLIFMRTFGHLTRKIPAITIPDDHDMYLPNIWGWEGKPPRGKRGEPGYKLDHGWQYSAEFYNLIVDTQTGHLPATAHPVGKLDSGLKTYYTRLHYGGTSFAVIEARTFKTPPYPDFVKNPETAEQLGSEQEAFIHEWGASLKPEIPRFIITQTAFVNPMTDKKGNISDDTHDSNAWPKPARDRAIAAMKGAGAFIMAGDIHNSVFTKMGVDGSEDGPYQFIPCAFAQFFQRWWEPRQPGGGWQTGDLPYTGIFKDGEGNPFRMIAAINAKIPFAKTGDFIMGRFIIDPNLTQAGYGIVEVDYASRSLLIEHWDRDADARDVPEQFNGWPVRVPIPLPDYANLETHRVLDGDR